MLKSASREVTDPVKQRVLIILRPPGGKKKPFSEVRRRLLSSIDLFQFSLFIGKKQPALAEFRVLAIHGQ
jgi:hypothetical protein